MQSKRTWIWPRDDESILHNNNLLPAAMAAPGSTSLAPLRIMGARPGSAIDCLPCISRQLRRHFSSSPRTDRIYVPKSQRRARRLSPIEAAVEEKAMAREAAEYRSRYSAHGSDPEKASTSSRSPEDMLWDVRRSDHPVDSIRFSNWATPSSSSSPFDPQSESQSERGRQRYPSSSTTDSRSPRTILDWSTHPTIQPREFNFLLQDSVMQPPSTFRSSSSRLPSPLSRRDPSSAKNTPTKLAPETGLGSWAPSKAGIGSFFNISTSDQYIAGIENPLWNGRSFDGSDPAKDHPSRARTWQNEVTGIPTRSASLTLFADEKAIKTANRSDGEPSRLGQLNSRDYLTTPKSIMAALKNKGRPLYSLYYSNRNYIKDGAATQLRACIKAAKEANVPVVYVDKVPTNRQHPVNTDISLETSTIVIPTIRGLEAVDPDTQEYKLCVNDERRIKVEPDYVGRNHKVPPVWLAVDEAEDPEDLANILHTAYKFGVNNVIYSRLRCPSLTGEITDLSRGAVDNLRIYGVTSIFEFLSYSKENGWVVLGSHSEIKPKRAALNRMVPTMTHDHEWANRPIIVVVGLTGAKIRPHLVSRCDGFLHVPSLCTSPANHVQNDAAETGAQRSKKVKAQEKRNEMALTALMQESLPPEVPLGIILSKLMHDRLVIDDNLVKFRF
ncbi:hypothetical protein BGW38_010553 [Lunasporangiospora selenospora]|uniref:tRNA/rRNA methyltransferase SpoU type domain-containing protein n=1 Tax=Lunasporangiospora selenospora TaxID=979761 RepID=A0A9P6FWW9_9FUNG|nr:hypothetical protein BGW38_010553 [Lunasporangiospora selenospora]